MAFDQNITYRVNVDDTNFQAKLTQMRASMDASMGGMSGGGFSSNMMYGMMGTMGGGGGYGGGGMADFGSQIRPVTYTPPAIAMQPHFGMFQVQQTLAQAGMGSLGPMGVGLSGAATNYRNGGFMGLLNGPAAVPNNVTMSEYMAMSARGFGDRAGDASAIGALTAGSTAASLAVGGVGASLGSAMFTGALGKAAGGLVGGMAGGMIVSAYTGAVTDMMADNRQLQSSLAAGSFRFFTGGGSEVDKVTGRGMGRRARFDVAQSIQGMEQNDLRYGMDDYKQILEGGMQFDLFSGTHDTSDFKTKFKGLVETLKTVTSTMHTSLKEGLEVIRGFRDMGVTDPSEVSRLTMGSEMRGRMSGRTGMEMMAVGQAGAEIFRGTGINMERGFELNQMNTVSVRSMLNSGGISRDTVAQAGGENSLAQQMTASALSSFQSAQGRAAMMANYNPGTGGMNPNMMGRLAGGDLMSQIAGAAAMGPGALMSFQANQESLIGKMSPQEMQMFGLSLDVGVAKTLRQSVPGLGMEDAIRVAGQMAGKSKAVIDTQLGMLHQDPEAMRADQQAAVENIRAQAGLEDFRNRFNIGKRISNSFRSNLVAPVEGALMDISTRVGEKVDNITLALEGAARVDTNIINAGSIAQAGTSAGPGGGSALDVSGSMYQRAIGGQTGQGLIDRASAAGTAHVFGNADEASAFAKTHGNVFTGKNSKGQLVGVTQSEAEGMAEEARGWQSSQSDKDDAGKIKLSIDTGKKLVEGDFSAEGLMHVVGGIQRGDMGMGDEAFQKKYKHSKGYFTALAGRYADTFGTAATQKNLAEKGDSGSSADAVRAGAAAASDDAEAKAHELMNIGRMDRRGKHNTILGDEGAQLTLYNPELDRGTKIAMLKADPKFNGADASAAVDFAMAHRSAKTDELVGSIKRDIQITASAQSSSASGGGGGAVGGDLSKETVKLLETQSVQLLNNYKALIALQEQLNKAMGKGGK